MGAVCDAVTELPCAPPARQPKTWFHELVSGRRGGAGAALLRVGLSALSVPYSAGVHVRNWLFDWEWKRVHRAAIPVVSIGNLTLGGTGKTPAVEYVARFYRRLGRQVGILSRGYGARRGRNDEALTLESNLPGVPHLQGIDRVALAQAAVEKLHCDVLLLDDGFQHRRLHRDLEIVLIDATNPWGFGRLFPRGLLREPARGLRRASLVLLTRCDQVGGSELATLREEVSRIAPDTLIVESIHAPLRLVNEDEEAPLTVLGGRPVAAFSGIGNPVALQKTLEGLHATLTAVATFPDHHPYPPLDVEWLKTWARRLPPDAVIVTTQKDLVKIRLSELSDRPVWALQIALTPTRGQDALDRLLEGTLA
jgi:tetraacyldisaccharide 4'-kinase